MRFVNRENIVVDAVQYTGENYKEIQDFVLPKNVEPYLLDFSRPYYLGFVPLKIENGEIIQVSDYVVKTKFGKIVVLKEIIFGAIFEPQIIETKEKREKTTICFSLTASDMTILTSDTEFATIFGDILVASFKERLQDFIKKWKSQLE